MVLVGAGTRMPKVQEVLQKYVEMELSKNLNTDEAAALGAVYKAADLSTGFKVKKFITKDAALFPVQVIFERDSRHIRRTLFNLMNPYPQKKIITFNRHTDDFTFAMNYAELNHLSQEDVTCLGSLNLTRVDVQGVKATLSKHASQPDVEYKGVKAHFAMDESGVLRLASAEAIFEKAVPETETDNESPLTKLGNTISKLFSSGDSTSIHENITSETQAEHKPAQNATATNNTTSTNMTKEETFKPKIITIKEPILFEETTISLKPMSPEQLDSSAKKLDALNEHDRQRTRRETALNQLETLVIDARSKLDTEEYSEATTDEEAEKILVACTEISDWLYEDGADADAETYERRILEIEELTHELYARVWEHHERPEALKALNQMLNGSALFLNNAKNLTKANNPEKDVFTDVEIETLNRIITDTTNWKDKMVLEQEKQKKSMPVLLSVKMITEKMAALDREVKYLVNKLKIWRPKSVPADKTKVGGKNTSEKTNTDEVNDNNDDGEAPIEDEPQMPSAEDNDSHSEL